jgi:cyanophycin synthetase
MAVVAPFLSSIKRGRLIVVMNAPGDRRDEDYVEIARHAAPHFDRVLLRDDEDLRGRGPGEVVGLLRDGLVRAGMSPERIEVARNEAEAVKRAISLARRDDLVVVFADRIAKVAALVDFERRKEARGEP